MAVLTSKGASGVQGAAFIALVATLIGGPHDPGGGYGPDCWNRSLHEHGPCRGEHDGNGVATVVVARWEKEIDGETLRRNLVRGSV